MGHKIRYAHSHCFYFHRYLFRVSQAQTLVKPLCTLCHFIFTAHLLGRFSYPHFTDKDVDSVRLACLRWYDSASFLYRQNQRPQIAWRSFRYCWLQGDHAWERENLDSYLVHESLLQPTPSSVSIRIISLMELHVNHHVSPPLLVTWLLRHEWSTAC